MVTALGRGLLAFVVMLLISCSVTKHRAPVGDGRDISDGSDSSVYSQGIGGKTRFDGQEQGESYTTRAPNNQVYLFAFDDSTFASKYQPSLNAQARYLLSHRGARIMLTGHTDSRGSREYNVALGERRANSVARLFFAAGVPKRQVRVVGYGEERPVAFGDDENSYRLNRRVELTYESIR